MKKRAVLTARFFNRKSNIMQERKVIMWYTRIIRLKAGEKVMQKEIRTVCFDTDLGIEAYRFEGVAQKFPNHFHEYYVIGFMEGGRRYLRCCDRDYSVGAGDLVVFNPADPHTCEQTDGKSFDYRCINVESEIMKKAVFEKNNLYFDMKYKTGGSDQAFFKQAMQAGYKFVACEEAPVYEVVSQERWMKSYYLRRALVNGFNSYRYIMNEPKNFLCLSSILRSAAALLVYAIATPFSIIMGNHVLINCLEKGFYHFSRICAMLGIELVKKRNF